MDKKSWPWKKKLSDKMSSPPELSDPSHLSASKQAEEQESSAVSTSNVPPDDEASSESNLKATSDQLLSSAAMVDVNAKDELVKQHMKIAEEAVAGWEKAEAEAADLKEKLEVALQQKLATEDRVSHLDGALRECMKQLRHVREEQEQRIHDVMVKKTREWEKVCTDLEARLDDATNELCEALAENQAMSKSLQERAKTIAEISDANVRLEADCSALQVRLASAEKENIRFKYELHVLSKELELRNGEREYVKRAEETASKQNLERSKKITKLEEECQRLRLLVKKRQPSPSPMSHMRNEADLLMNDRIRRRSPCRRSTTSLPIKASELSGTEFGFDDGLKEENKLLSEQLLAMQDEAKSLRELLAKKDNELQSARLICARAASKLSNAEDRLDNHPCSCNSTKSASAALLSRQLNGVSMDLSIDSVSAESGIDDVGAESWASALIAELAHFKTESKAAVCDSVQTPISIDLMDDFAEMEKLASLSSPDDACNLKKTEECQGIGKSTQECVEKPTFSEGAEYSNEQEFESINELCKALKHKLADAEDQLYALQEKQSTSDATINQLQQLLALKFGLEAEGVVLNKALEAAKLAIECERGAKAEPHGRESGEVLAESEGEKESSWPSSYVSHVESAPQGTSDMEFHGIGADLAAAMRKVLDIVESIGQTDYTFPYAEWISTPSLENDGMLEFSSPGKQWRSSGLDACVDSLINLCNSLVQGKVDIIDFIAEVASALDWLVGLIFTPPDKPSTRNISQRLEQSCGERLESSDSEMISAESSPTQLLCNASDGEEAKTMESPDVLPADQSSVSNLSFQFSESSVHEEDMSKRISEEAALKVSLEAETRKASRFESEILRLKVVNDQLEHNHELTMRKIADLEAQALDANQRLHKLTDELIESENRSANLESQLQDVLDQKQSIVNVVEDLEYAKNTLESELCIARENVEALESKVLRLEEELSGEIRSRKEFELQLIELKEEQKHHQEGSYTPEHAQSPFSAADEATRLKKEQEIAAAAEKLAECQQTIMDLGKQLKALGVPKNVFEAPFTRPSESPVLPAAKMSSATIQRLRSASDEVHSRVSDASTDTQCNVDPTATSTSRGERDRRQEQGGITKSLKNTGSLNQEGEPGTPVPRRGVQGNGRHGRQAPLDVYSNHRGYNRFPSPTHGDKEGGEGSIGNSNTTSEPVVNSPLRSPARFLSLRSKNANTHEPSKHGDNEAAEKHGSTGFSRFFARTKSGH
eukprot:c23217_g1_i1 orf=139-3852(+)